MLHFLQIFRFPLFLTQEGQSKDEKGHVSLWKPKRGIFSTLVTLSAHKGIAWGKTRLMQHFSATTK